MINSVTAVTAMTTATIAERSALLYIITSAAAASMKATIATTAMMNRNTSLNVVPLAWRWCSKKFTPTDGYRRVHMAHHREEFCPDEPDIPLYAGYPISHESFRRKMVRDATGRTGWKLMRSQLRGLRSPDARTRRTTWKILGVQALLLALAIVAGVWWLYPFFWVLPYLTVWRVINRLRSIAEHGGMQRSKDRRETTHSVRQHPVARFFLVPYRIGWHLAHHVDSGIPFRHLPAYHEALREAGYVDATLEHASYPALWKALRAG